MSSWAGGSTRAWRKIRARVLQRDGHLCRLQLDERPCPKHGQRCAVRCSKVATHAHHVLGRAVTGDDERWIVAACRPCNLHIGEPTTPEPQGKALTQW